MPKRKSENSDDYEHLYKKFKKLEKRLLRRRRQQSSRSRSRSPDNSYRSEYEEPEYEYFTDSETHVLNNNNIAGLLDGSITTPVPENCDNAEATVKSTEEPTGTTPTVLSSVAVVPNTSTPITENQANNSGGEVGSTEMTLASEIIEILGEDPTISNTYGDEIHKDLAVRLEHTALHGLSKELRKELLEKYLQPSNCKLVGAPALNAEIKAGISDITAKRDKSIEIRQKQIASAISSLANALNILISKDNADPAIVKMLMDTERILCDCQHNDSTIRRNFILSAMKKDMRDQLQITKPDNFLFGQNLTETIKTAKAINRSGAELKTPLPKPQTDTNNKKFQATASTSKNLNWKGPYPPRKQPYHPRTKEHPPNRKRPSNSSRHSQQQRRRDRR